MLCDSNILIYAASRGDTSCRAFVEREDAAISVVSRIEVLGFPGFGRLTDEERSGLQVVISSLVQLEISGIVVERAILLRQQKKMTLGDALIAATALVHQMPLVTRNVDDFRHVVGLQVIDPFSPT